jgi:hypothetical protein
LWLTLIARRESLDAGAHCIDGATPVPWYIDGEALGYFADDHVSLDPLNLCKIDEWAPVKMKVAHSLC